MVEATTIFRVIATSKALMLLVITGQFKGTVKQLIHVDLFANQLVSGRGFTFVDKVAATEFIRGQAQLTSHLIEMSLQSKYALRRAESSKRSVGWQVSSHC